MDSQENDKFNQSRHINHYVWDKLALRLQKGDMKAGEKLFDHFSVLIYRFFMARVLNKEIAQDLTQDVFVKVVSKIGSFNENSGNFSGWIWKIAKNSLIDHYRVKKEVLFSDDAESLFGSYSIELAVEDRIKVKDVLDIVENFSEEEREIFSLFYISDLPYKEISKITGKSEGSLRVAAHRIIQKIRKTIHG